MPQPLKTILGILLALGSFILIMWVLLGGHFNFTREMFTNSRFNLGQKFVLNILGVIGLGLGLKLAGWDFNRKPKPFEDSAPGKKKKEEKPKEEIKLKEFKEDDHDRFMPK